MQNDPREVRAETLEVLLPWGMPSADAPGQRSETMGLWLTGGASLLLWTGLALLLTAS